MRRLAVFAGSFSAGIFLAQYLCPDTWLLPGAFLFFILALVCLMLPRRLAKRAVVIGAALSLSLGYNWLYLRQVQRPAGALAGTERTVMATLCGYAEESVYGARVTVRIDGVPGKAVCYGEDSLLDLEPGQTITGPVQLRSAGQIRDEDITTFTSKGVFLLAFSRGTFTVEAGSMGAFQWLPVRLARRVQDQLASLFEADTAGFLSALLTGDRLDLSEEAEIALTEAGLFHIMAVSGMHCGILMGLVSAVTGKRSRLAAGVTIPLLWFYALLTGASPSAVRACIMLSLAAAAPLFRRENDGPTALTAALMLILLANPFAAASVSLQLSFAAMAGMLWAVPRLERVLLGRKEVPPKLPLRFVCGAVSASFGAMVFSAPLSGYYFGTLSLAAPLSSLLCLWAVSLVFGLGALAVSCSLFLPFLGKFLSFPVVLFIRYILWTAGIITKIPGHAVYFSNPYLKYWLVYVYLLFALALFMKRPGRRRYVLAAALAALTLAVTAKLGETRYCGALDAIVLDVGQGQSVVLASGGQFALVDCGSGSSWRDAGLTAAQHLQSMGCRRLDYIILTHFDSDHVSGVPGLLARVSAESLLVPEGGEGTALLSTAAERGTEISIIEEPVTLALGQARLVIYPPVGSGDSNEEGLTILASAGENDLLITGDMGGATEKILLATYPLPDIEGLVAGHHGSRYSTSQALLEAVAPETAVISVGNNAYGHPSEETLQRLARQGCTIYRTDLHGSVHLAWGLEDS